MKTILIVMGITMLVLAGIVGFLIKGQVPEAPETDLGIAFTKNYGDVIGTKTGSSTPTPVAFGVNAAVPGQSATSTYISKISGADQATYMFSVEDASSTANLRVSLFGSNDDYCDTDAVATSTSEMDVVMMWEIDWFDLGNHLSTRINDVGASGANMSINTGSTTINWVNPLVGTGKEIVLNDLNYECLKMEISGSSTEVYAGLRLKNF